MRINGETLEIIPTLSVEPIEVLEGELARFSLELDSAASVDVSFNYSTQDLEAIAGADYVANSGSVVIPAGETTAVVEIETKQDNLYNENSESFVLKITELTGATFADNATEYTVAAEIANQERDEPMNLAGTSGNDTLNGGTGNDSIRGDSGNDILNGNNGDDTLRGHSGNDLLNGEDGDDSLYGSYGSDTIAGGSGRDRLLEYGNVDFTLTDTKLTGLGTDTINEIELARLQGGAGDNKLDATGATGINVTLDGAAGDDSLYGGGQADFIVGRDGDDSLRGNNGNDSLYGSLGQDTLRGNGGDDLINGGDGDDSL
ncbi:MAG: Calx-beta domain-containing protein [Cyanobacteria bacterium J06582_2]